MNQMPSIEQVDALIAKIKVMKPASINKDNPKDVMKLDALLDNDDYVEEEKIDGVHYLNVADRFYSKDHIDKTNNFPHLTACLIELGFPAMILDGEIFYPGKTSQYVTKVTGAGAANAIAFQQANGWCKYKVFDILRAPNGQWLHRTPYYKRRHMLEYLFAQYINVNPEMARHFELVHMVEKDKRAYKDYILSIGGEGTVLKHKESLYMFGKKPKWQWMKIKQAKEADMFISGFKAPNTKYEGGDYTNWPYWKEVDGISLPVTKPYYYNWPGSIELSGYVDGERKVLCYVSGLSDELSAMFANDPDSYIDRVVRMRYMELTEGGNFRHPTFKEFHEDKTPQECKFYANGKEVTD